MPDAEIRNELKRFTKQLNELIELVNHDCGHDENDRYNYGLLVGIVYTKKELERLIKELES